MLITATVFQQSLAGKTDYTKTYQKLVRCLFPAAISFPLGCFKTCGYEMEDVLENAQREQGLTITCVKKEQSEISSLDNKYICVTPDQPPARRTGNFSSH